MFNLIKIENGRMNVPEPEFLPAKLEMEWKEDAEYQHTSGTAYTTTGQTPITQSLTKTLGAKAYNSTDSKSWTCVGIHIPVGAAMVLSGGELVRATGTTAPAFITMGEKKVGDENRTIPVCRIEKNQVYEVPVSATPTSLNVGDRVTLNSDGLQVTATTTSGVVTIVDLNGATAQGDKIIVRI